jgi:hypothetical protein
LICKATGIGNNWVSYVKSPGTLCFVPAGVPSGARARSDFELAVCALECKLVSGIDEELDRRPTGELRLRTNFKDPAAQQLLKLLLADFASESPAGRLYTDHLIHALAYRVLVGSGVRTTSCGVIERVSSSAPHSH